MIENFREDDEAESYNVQINPQTQTPEEILLSELKDNIPEGTKSDEDFCRGRIILYRLARENQWRWDLTTHLIEAVKDWVSHGSK